MRALSIALLGWCVAAQGASYPVKSSSNRRYLVDQNNTPFLMVGDSPQSLMVNVSEADAATYFANRQTNNFNSLWVNLLCVTYTYGRSDGSMLDGTLPFTNTLSSGDYDLTTPNPIYFAHVDRIINSAAAHGLQIILDPIETGGWLNTALANGTTRCRAYGQYLGNRFRNFPNLIWMSGNDFQNWQTPANDAVILAVVAGIRDFDTAHLHTAELDYLVSDTLEDPNWAPLAGLDAVYTYYPVYDQMLIAYQRSNYIPTFLVESHYENEDVGGELGTLAVLRKESYWAWTSGGSGYLYGSSNTVRGISMTANSTLNTVGVQQLEYALALFLSRDWWTLVPDINHQSLISGYGAYSSTGLISANNYATATRTADGHTLIVYAPNQRTLAVDMTKISGSSAKAWWYNPQTGVASNFATYSTTGSQNFTPPDNNDWVLVLDDASLPFGPPGSGTLRVSTTSLPPGTIGVPYSAQMQASGGASPYTWSLAPSSGPLPAGLSLSASGLISGTPANASTNNLVVQVTDSATTTATQPLVLVVTQPDTAAPSTPGNLLATVVSSGQINLSWNASTDNVGVTGYLVERSQGSGSTSFTQIGSATATTYSDNGLTPATVYNYRVRATDAAGNLSGYSAVASATTPARTSGLVAAYGFNEGAGSTVTDLSGSGNNGTINGATWTAAGKYGNALVFNGSGALVTINNSASLQLTTAMTLEAWVNPSTVSGSWRDVIYKGNDNYYLEASSTSGGAPSTGGTFNSSPLYGPAPLAANTWSHLAATYDGATLRLYVNGTQMASRSQIGNIATSTNPLQIGGDSFYGQYFQGILDELRVYNVALSAAQIQADMNTTLGGATNDTQAPTIPGSLSAAAISATQINLSWTASTDNVGVTGYLVERSQGSGSTSFTQITSVTGTSYNNTGLTPSTVYNYRVRATDAAGNLSGYSAVASVTTPAASDTTPPSAPANLAATATSSSQISLSWGASTDNVGVTGYLIERSQGSGSTSFTQITSVTGTSYNNTGLTPSTVYNYRVRATDASGNLSGYSAVASATTPAASAGLVAAYSFNEGAGSTVTDQSGTGNNGTITGASWTAAGKYGNALVFNGSGALVTVNNSASLQLTTALTLEAWVNPSTVSGAWRDVIFKGNDNYYLEATSTSGGAPAAGGTFNTSPLYGPAPLAANTWSHLAATYDGATIRLFVNGTQVASRAQTGNIASSSNPLQIGGDSLYGQYFQGVIDEVRVYNVALSAAQIQTDMNTPIGATTADTQAPTTPGNFSAAAVSGTQINLSWTASTDNVGVTGYLVERSQGSGSTSFTQIGSATGTTYSDTGLTPGTVYSYRVRATDAAGNLSGYSTVASATTSAASDTTPPSAPANLAATAMNRTRVSLSWGASTDNVGVTGYLLERAVSGGSFSQIAVTANTSFSDSGLTSRTTYSYRVRASDAAGNLSPYSITASATTR